MYVGTLAGIIVRREGDNVSESVYVRLLLHCAHDPFHPSMVLYYMIIVSVKTHYNNIKKAKRTRK